LHSATLSYALEASMAALFTVLMLSNQKSTVPTGGIFIRIGRYIQALLPADLQTYIHYLIKTIRTSLCSSKLKPTCHYDRNYRYKRRQRAMCCSLLSSTSGMGRSGELSDFERGLVIGCHISKKSLRDIATLLKLPK
jgi:hypothetical protein